MFVVVNRYLLRKGFNGITIWPFVILRHKGLKKDAIFIQHERIHLKQQIELLILPFYVWYVIEFLIRLFQYKNRNLAYRNISFEREAYTHEADENYLQSRPLWRFAFFLSSNSPEEKDIQSKNP